MFSIAAITDEATLFGIILVLSALVLGFFATLILFASLKQELARTVRRERRRTERLLEQLQAQSSLGKIPGTALIPAQIHRLTPPGDSQPMLGSSQPMLRRAEVLRRVERGEPTAAIAHELKISRGEVQLLANLGEMMGRRIAGAAAGGQGPLDTFAPTVAGPSDPDLETSESEVVFDGALQAKGTKLVGEKAKAAHAGLLSLG